MILAGQGSVPGGLGAEPGEHLAGAALHVVELLVHQPDILQLALQVGALVGQDLQKTLQLAGVTVGHGVIHHDHLADRKSTRLNSSHVRISYAVFCLKKKTKTQSIKASSPDAAEGIVSTVYLKDPTDKVKWGTDAGLKLYYALMAKYCAVCDTHDGSY